MKILRRSVLVLGLGLMAFGSVQAQDRGSSDDAIAMVKKGIAYIKEVGKEKAFAEFANPANKSFHDRDLYLFVYDQNGINLSHGVNPKMQGKNLLEMRAGDKFIIKEMIELTNAKGKGWVDYQWPNPVSKALEAKSSYVEKVDNYFVGCGVYK
ncbi:cache domain-containing protein [Undibacterium rugosum]|uniref:cache domain-containing protein n=1 Tax=Undibacterium rugosum TaxID=2762291 RepID=UPI001B81E11B|nr:cache domain-containing protein [Undibacterium rugosum]MBR7778154.1 cache domain-containing protein [Undibacterium rugosum]